MSEITIDSAQNEWNNLEGPLNPNQKKKEVWKGEWFSQMFTEFYEKLIRSSTSLYPNFTPDIKILAQTILQLFCSQGCFSIQNAKIRKGT